MIEAIRDTLIAIIMSIGTMYVDRTDSSLLVYCICCIIRSIVCLMAGIRWGQWLQDRSNKQ